MSGKNIKFANVIELERHIEILLLSNDCIIVPDFGGFMAHHVDARHDEEDNMFLPPLRTVGFNPQLTLNDSLLAQSYIEAYDLSYPEAIKRIASEVNELKQRILNDGQYEMNDLGIISLNSEGKYEFEPCEAGVLTPEFYGFGAFEMKPLNCREEQPQAVQVTPAAKEEPLRVVSLQDEEAGASKTINIKVSLLHNIAAAAAVLLLFFLLPSKLGNKVTYLSTTGMGTELLQKIMPHDITVHTPKSGQLNQGQQQLSKQEPVSSTATTMATKQEETQNGQPHYCIVLASKVSKANAEAFVKKLQGMKYLDVRVLPKKGNIKVVMGNFASESDAYRSLRALRGNNIFKEAWVLEIK